MFVVCLCTCVCLNTGVEDSEGWSEHRTREGTNYYHNCLSGASQWERPPEYKDQSRELSREEIQVHYSKTKNLTVFI